ncbi:hypothetical protein [Ascidiaceihabitans sp.]
MFRMIRTIIFVAVAFVAGVLYEQYNDGLDCDAKGGEMIEGLCEGTLQ